MAIYNYILQREESIAQFQDAIDVIEHNERGEQKITEKENSG